MVSFPTCGLDLRFIVLFLINRQSMALMSVERKDLHDYVVEISFSLPAQYPF